MSRKVKIYIISILIPIIIGTLVGLIMSKTIDYESLKQPPLAPTSILFPIVWTILYILMGISYALLKTNNQVDGSVNIIYYSQLVVNALWSIIFFTLKWRLFAFIWILLLATLVIIMIISFYKRNRVAGLLQIPYLLWVVFASYLNIAIYILNK